MPLYRVKFMNQIVETYVVEAASEEEAWNAHVWDVEAEDALESEVCFAS